MFKIKTLIILTVTLVVLFSTSAISAVIKGKIVEESSDEGLRNVTILIKELNIRANSDSKGNFSFKNVDSGEYTIEIYGSGVEKISSKITVKDGENELDFKVNYKSVQLGDLEVYSSSRRLQKITEAPSAISIITSDQLQKATSHGQIGKTMEHLPGVDVVQSGMNDFNINTRGFNNSINRRTLVLIDGRDPSTPMLNLVEWNSLQTNLSDIKSIEVVRGPGSALYGMNAYNGVINITTNSPKDVQGTLVNVGGGEYNTFRTNVRHAGSFLDNFYYKVTAGYSTQYQAWVKSRDTKNGGVLEYEGLRPDVTGNRTGNGIIGDIDSLIKANKNAFNMQGTFRLDYELSDNEVITGEVGYSEYGNEYFVNQTGRILIPQIQSPYVRFAYNSEHWSLNTHWRKRLAPIPQIVMNAAASSGENSDAILADLQRNDSFFDNKLKVITGASFEYQNIITASGGSAPLLVPDSISHNFQSVYGQIEYNILDNLQFVFAGRVDASSLFETQFSPKAALVWTPVTDHTLRFTVNRSFLRPSYPEYSRLSPAGAPIDSIRQITPTDTFNLHISQIDTLIANEFGLNPLGLGRTSVINVGNPNIGVETAWSYEIGYKGVVSDKMFVTADFYLNQRSNFISNPLPGLTPSIFTPVRYENDEANAKLKEQLEKANLSGYSGLSIYPNNGQISVIVAPENIGLVNEYGAEFSINYYVLDNLLLTGNYSYLGFEVVENEAKVNKILPNTSPHRLNLGAEFNDKVANLPFNLRVNVRGSKEFKWIAGLFEGTVPEYWVVNLSGDIDLTKDLNFGFNVFNLLDRRHYQIFGGTILQRYATANLTYEF